MDVLKIKTEKELKAWFEKRPPAVAQVIAARTALRVLPYVVDAKNVKKFESDILLPVFWAVTTSWVATAAYAAAAVWNESLQDCAFFENAIEQGGEAEHAARDLAGLPL